MNRTDTIAAIATAPGLGGISIVRVSGPEAERILGALFHPAGGAWPLPTRLMTYGQLRDGDEPVDECMAGLMRAARSYTREDVAELHLHGGGYTAQRALRLCVDAGARLAEPGEFTRRAFLNGRIDLSQAEAVMALIAAQGEKAHRAALRQLEGGAGQFIREAADELYGIQAGIAACIDYPEEISDEEAAADLVPRILALAERLEAAADERAARLTREGLRVALCGKPNVGKSSLLNALLGEDRAIVTPIPGTTRDAIEGQTTLGGSVIHLADTAGLHDTEDPVERIGVERARRTLREADVVLAVLDASRPLTAEDERLLADTAGLHHIVVWNKCDLPCPAQPEPAGIRLSAHRPETLTPLKEALAAEAAVSDQVTLVQPRHLEAARRSAAHLREAADTLAHASPDLITLDLDAAQLALAEITGDTVEEKLLDRVFADFCVGK